MMIKLMTWFIELQNRFNESRLFKISMIYILNWVDDLTSWQKTWKSFDFDRDSWWKNMIESHKEKSWRLFN